ncbi:MAG TPA: hypothetical protein ENG42_01660 [Candidatus Aenigmarchaeota archaeon]|nr:hypothetical protein [Candidatus Aenigmarchaeota archaeon]
MIKNIAYISGVICGGGNITYDRQNSKYFIKLSSKSRKKMLKFYDILKELSKNTKLYKYRDRFVVLLRSKYIVSKIIKTCNIKFTRREWRVPPFVKKNITYTKIFLSGFFDRAAIVYMGKVAVNNRLKGRVLIRVASINREGLQDIKSLLEKMNVKCILYPAGKCYYLDVCGIFNVSQLLKNIPIIHSDKISLGYVNST